MSIKHHVSRATVLAAGLGLMFVAAPAQAADTVLLDIGPGTLVADGTIVQVPITFTCPTTTDNQPVLNLELSQRVGGGKTARGGQGVVGFACKRRNVPSVKLGGLCLPQFDPSDATSTDAAGEPAYSEPANATASVARFSFGGRGSTHLLVVSSYERRAARAKAYCTDPAPYLVAAVGVLRAPGPILGWR